MKHSIDRSTIDAFADPMIEAIDKCVHCGLCLPTCPTYQVEQQEMDSPRGRIILMKEVLENNIEPEDATEYLDRCLGCVACETACPSNVEYGKLITSFRTLQNAKKTRESSSLKRLAAKTITNPTRFRWAIRIGKLARRFSGLLPRSLRPMLELIPAQLPKPDPLPASSPAQGVRKYRVGLLAGCAQQVLAPEINRATIEFLNRQGCEVVVPKKQGCCGALNWHHGEVETTRSMAIRNFEAFPDDLDAIVTNAAGCGSGIQDYPLVFEDHERSGDANQFVQRCMDLSQFLSQIDVNVDFRFERPTRVAYQDACHLVHAQKIRNQTRDLLRQIENLELVPIRDPENCCGSAGTYNLDQPKISAELGRRKVQAILDSNCERVVTGNIGCLIQIRKFIHESGSSLPVHHWIELLNGRRANEK